MMKILLIHIVLLLLPLTTGYGQSINRKMDNEKMVLVSGGSFTPLYKADDEVIKIEDFYMDVYPVTNAEFLEFLRNNPKWQRSNVKKIFADKYYLKHWKNDLEPGNDVNLNSPVTNISWFAAKAYAEWAGKRLPTVAEWEYAASASRTKPDAGTDKENIKRIQEWYSRISTVDLKAVGSTEKNYWGIYDMFGLIWEWTFDFNNAMVTGESRGDGSIQTNLFCGSGSSSAQDVTNYPAFMRYGFRSSLKANYTVSNLGFRCAKDKNNKKVNES